MSGLIAQRSGLDADDFETRVTVMVMVSAAMEAMREWLRQDGKGSFVALVNQTLDLVEAGARLDKVASPKHAG
jgi:MftR C-terminal domain